MKKILALLALVLGVVSCQTEPEGLDVNVGGEVETTVCVSLPEATRANSAEGAFANVDWSVYTIRYQMEIYDANGRKSDAIYEKYLDGKDGKSVVFPVRLVPGRHYNFVVWADIVKDADHSDLHYNTENLNAVSVITTNNQWKAMDETRDAFTGYFNTEEKNPNVKYSSSMSINIPLTRPFAKLRVITTDMVELDHLDITPAKAIATYTTAHYSTFNACDATYSGELTNVSHEYVIASYNETGANKTIFTDYFFADDSDVVKFNLDVMEANDTRIKYNDFSTDIFVQRNYLTTIQGNILTDGNNVEVKVEDAFVNGSTWNPAEDEYDVEIVEVGNAADLQQVIEEAEVPTTVVLGGDINLGDLFGAGILSTRATAAPLPIVVAADKSLVLELNGYKITTPWEDEATQKHYYAFDNSGSLTIKDSKGNGEIVARGIFNRGTLTLESGKIDACDGNGGYGVRNYDGAMFIMNGGSIVTSNEDGDAPTEGYDATTLRVDEGATATINGGVVNNVSNYTFAIDNYGEVEINGGTFTSIHSTVSTYGTMTIKGGTFTCNGLEGVTAHALVAWEGSETTINGGTFDGKDNYNGFNVDACKGAIVNINGGKFLPVHSGSLYGDGTINVKGGTFFDDPSLRVVKGYVAEKNGDVFEVSQIALEAKFADNSWDKIILACQNDIVPETWAVGDKKEMTIDGKTCEIAIIGKNHDTYTGGDTKAPLTFQLFQLYGTAAQMNEIQDNTTGWSGSKMRNTTMADILNVMPDAVKNAIKAVDKVSLNGSKSALETTSDKLFLLSEIEVNGSTYYSGGYVEGSRYAYYADQIMDSKGNIISQIMKPNGWIVSWYLRTPKNDKDDDTRFVAINGSGYMTHITAEIASGVVFGFCF